MLKPKSRRWTPDDLPAEAMGLRLVRIVQPGDRLRHYEAVKFPGGASHIAQFLRQQMLPPETWEPGKTKQSIDVIDGDGFTILDEIDVATVEAFQRLRRKLKCKVESTDGDPIPAALSSSGGDRG